MVLYNLRLTVVLIIQQPFNRNVESFELLTLEDASAVISKRLSSNCPLSCKKRVAKFRNPCLESIVMRAPFPPKPFVCVTCRSRTVEITVLRWHVFLISEASPCEWGEIFWNSTCSQYLLTCQNVV